MENCAHSLLSPQTRESSYPDGQLIYDKWYKLKTIFTNVKAVSNFYEQSYHVATLHARITSSGGEKTTVEISFEYSQSYLVM